MGAASMTAVAPGWRGRRDGFSMVDVVATQTFRQTIKITEYGARAGTPFRVPVSSALNPRLFSNQAEYSKYNIHSGL